MMHWSVRKTLMGLAIGTAAVALAGCTVEPDDGYVEPGVYAEPAGYYYTTPEYYDGYYAGPDWRWHDHDGHWYHERRELHEQHAREFHERGGHFDRR